MAKQSALSVFISAQASAISELLATDPKVAAIFEENGVVLAEEEAEAPKAAKGKGRPLLLPKVRRPMTKTTSKTTKTTKTKSQPRAKVKARPLLLSRVR